MQDREQYWYPGAEQGWVGARFRHKQYYRWSKNWDHDHCNFCWAVFEDPNDPNRAPDSLREGYAQAATESHPDDYEWVCDVCFAAFKDRCAWQVIE